MMEFFWRRLRRGDRGFTLIELLIVVAIIAILAAILIPNFLRSRAQSQVSASKGNLRNIGTALESYLVDKGFYPGGTDLYAAGVVTPTYLGRVPTDPCAASSGAAAYGYVEGAGTYTVSTAPWTDACKASNEGKSGLKYQPDQGIIISP